MGARQHTRAGPQPTEVSKIQHNQVLLAMKAADSAQCHNYSGTPKADACKMVISAVYELDAGSQRKNDELVYTFLLPQGLQPRESSLGEGSL
jgi:hypothetical protein